MIIKKAKKNISKKDREKIAKKRKPMSEATKKKISWTMERRKKYSDNDSTKRPAAGVRKRYWVKAYTRTDGTYIKGHYQSNPYYDPIKAKAAKMGKMK